MDLSSFIKRAVIPWIVSDDSKEVVVELAPGRDTSVV